MELIVISIVKAIYVCLLLTIILALFTPMVRAFTKGTRSKDFDYMLFWMLAMNRLWFFARAYLYGNPIDRPYEGLATIVVYIFAIAVEAGVIVSYSWHRRNKPLSVVEP